MYTFAPNPGKEKVPPLRIKFMICCLIFKIYVAEDYSKACWIAWRRWRHNACILELQLTDASLVNTDNEDREWLETRNIAATTKK